jgi:hypothetical protein
MFKFSVEIKFINGEILSYGVENVSALETCKRKILRFLSFCKTEVENNLPLEKIINNLENIDLELGVLKHCNEYSIEISVIRK